MPTGTEIPFELLIRHLEVIRLPLGCGIFAPVIVFKERGE